MEEKGFENQNESLTLENIQLPKINCKYEGCTYERSDGQIVKRHEDVCREGPITC